MSIDSIAQEETESIYKVKYKVSTLASKEPGGLN